MHTSSNPFAGIFIIMSSQLPTVFAYNDFRKYLADYQQGRQNIDKHFTRSNFSRLMYLPNTRSYFNDVIKGKRVTTTFIERFITVLNLNKEEANYFRILVKFNQSIIPDEREMFFEQLVSLNRTPHRTILIEEFAYYQKWFHSAIRALLNIFDFSNNYSDLARKLSPPISSKEARSAILLLSRLNLISKNEQGNFKPTAKSITTPPYVQDELVKQFQLQYLRHAQKAILTNQKHPFNVSTNTISISDEGFRRIEKRLQSFKKEVRSIVHKDEKPADRMYQLNVTLLPLSQ